MKKNSMDFSQLIIGIDVSKDDLHMCISGLDAVKGMNIIRQSSIKKTTSGHKALLNSVLKFLLFLIEES